MSSKKTKLLESAQKNFLKGFYDKSIMEYRQIIQLDPADIRHRQRLAEILTKANQKDEAINEYTSLAKHYIDSVHYLKAIAVYKQIQKLDPTNPDISLTLATLNEKQGLIGNATSEYASATRIYESKGENLKALKALESMLALDPGNFAVRLRVAEKNFSVGREEPAANEFVDLARDLREKDDETGFQHVADKIHQLFRGKAAALFTRINEDKEAAEQIDQVAEIPAQSVARQLSVETLPPPAPPTVSAEPSPEPEPEPEPVPLDNASAFADAGDSQTPENDEELEYLELVDEVEDIEELEELEELEIHLDDADWEEEIDLESLTTQEATFAATLQAADEDAVPVTDADLEDLELELEVDADETSESAPSLADEQAPDILPAYADESVDLGKELSLFADEIDFDLIEADKGDTRFDLDSPSGFMRSELDNEDAESHYSLGLAYKEMGLFDEAISEFIVASHSAVRKIDCLILQGVCFRETGEIDKAVHILTDTLQEPGLKEDEILGIKYELAVCHEAVAETAQAKKLYDEILSIRPDFSDTATRLSQL